MSSAFFPNEPKKLYIDDATFSIKEGKTMTVIIKLRTTGKKIKPYLANAPTSGKAQEKFKQNYGIPVGNCVKQNVKKGMSIGAIHDAVRRCAGKGGATKA